ncbi:MAG: response regulator [Anaerolineae bacterium]|nr:response regulator [Anaerolineae bacterium]
MTDTPESSWLTILIVDDDWMNREIVEAHLVAAGYRVATAASGEQALELVLSDLPDLVLLDVRLPGMEGYEVCRRLKSESHTRHVPVVMITALDTEADRRQALEAGADDTLIKPISSHTLLARIRKWTGSQA